MNTRFRQRLTRPVTNHDDSGSMILALFTVMVLTSLVSVVLMVAISQQGKTRKATDFTFAGQAANTAVNDALFMANSNTLVSGDAEDLDSVEHWGEHQPREGVTGDFMWSWWSKALNDTTQTWEITATGCRNTGTTPPTCTANSARTVIATLTGEAVNGVAQPGYVLGYSHNFGRALWADEELVLKGTTRVTSYNRAIGSLDSGFGQVGTNGLAALDTSVVAGVDGIFFSNTRTQPSSERCNGGACDPLKVHDIPARLQTTDPKFTAKIGAVCASATPVAWVASETSPRGSLDVPVGVDVCYSSMTFDVDTTVNGATGTPAKVYVAGPVTVGANVNVNVSDPTPEARKLQIFSSGTVVTIGPGAQTNQTEVAWALWAPKALCSTNGSGYATVYGSMVCRKISVQGTFNAKWDEDLRTWATDHVDGATVWDISDYRDGVPAVIEPTADPAVP